ncbi:hypothetical protein [Streptomyces sp. NBC_00057]|uniref:hypothetical protein n=1 Tax=Streptomyces sp. NBC_00057 TaxID=2975634 RepID=UPI003253A20B
MFAARMGWVLAVDVAGDQRRGVPRRLAWQVSLGLNFNYFRDDALRVSYVSFMSNLGQEIADHLTGLVTAGIDVLDDVELLQGVVDAGSKKERADAVIKVGLGAPREFDERFFGCLVHAARDAAPEFREAAVQAIFHTKWQQFTDVLTDISSADPKKAVRELATRVLAALDTGRS